jgi:DNA-binding LacI/PurR family transcriptional regulator
MMQCITYLKNLGHRRIAFINQSEKSYKSGYGPVLRTHEAFDYFCGNFDIAGSEFFCGSDPAVMYAQTESILAACPGMTAFIIMNDKALPGLIKGIEKKQLRIPDDISIISVVSSDNAASFFLPSITTFEMNISTLMDLTVTQLISKLEGRYSELSSRLIPCVLRERQSTGRCKKG